MNWKPISDPPIKFNRDLLVWDGEHFRCGGYTKTDGFYAYDSEGDENDSITHYMAVYPPQS